jgi:hypothetical protein
MGNLLSTLLRTVVLDDSAYREWHERPNLFLRGIVLIVVISLVASLLSFAVTLVDRIRPVDVDEIEEMIYQSFEWQQYFPFYQDMEPEAMEMMQETLDFIVPMTMDITQIESPLPRSIAGFFEAMGGWLSRALMAIGGWLAYGALVLVFANLLGGSAKLPDFMGMVALYVIPGLLGLLSPIACLGAFLALIGTVWSIVVYIKATSTVTGLDTGRAILAVVAPFLSLMVLGFLLAILWTTWLAILF